MNKEVLPNRWFIWTVVFLLAVAIYLLGETNLAIIEMETLAYV